MSHKTTQKNLHPILTWIVNILCIIMVIAVSLQNKTFAIIFFSLAIASQCAFWGVRKLWNDKKKTGKYSILGIILTTLSIIPLYIAIFCILNYGAIELYLGSQGRSAIGNVIKISFFIKP